MGLHRGARDTLDALPAPHARPRVGVRPVQVVEHGVERTLERRIATRLQRALDQPPLALDLVGRQRRPQRHLRHQPEQGLPASRQGRAPHLPVFDVSRGVERAAEILDRLGQLHGGVLPGAADHHPVQEIGDAGRVGGLEERAGPHLQGGGDHADRRIRAHEHRQPVGQHPADRRRRRRRLRRDEGESRRDAGQHDAEDEEQPAHERGGISATRT